MANAVYLWKVNGAVKWHTDLNAAKQLDGLGKKPDKTVSMQDWEKAGGLVRIINGAIVLGKTDAEKAADAERDNLIQEAAGLQKELAEKDYKVIKAAEMGKSLDQVDPGLRAQREQARARINAIETRLEELGKTA